MTGLEPRSFGIGIKCFSTVPQLILSFCLYLRFLVSGSFTANLRNCKTNLVIDLSYTGSNVLTFHKHYSLPMCRYEPSSPLIKNNIFISGVQASLHNPKSEDRLT